ncbi:MAG: hypothetical protein IJ397_05475 [Lachnospiraceae bacterium]|nr:hypothetical protein [Lachnospiraceae bacterium]
MGESKSEKKKYTLMEIILIIGILFFPLLAMNILVILLLIFAIMLFLSVVVLAVLGIFQLLAGVAMVGVGIEKLFSMPMGAVAVMGFGVCNIGVALLAECLVFWWYGVAVPAFYKKIMRREENDEKKA